MIKQIKFVSIPVRDQNRALDFYTDKLGFTIITDQPFDEKQRWIVYEHVVHLRRDRQNVRGIETARRRIRRSPTKTTVGHLRDVQGQRRKSVRSFVRLTI